MRTNFIDTILSRVAEITGATLLWEIKHLQLQDVNQATSLSIFPPLIHKQAGMTAG